MTPLPPCAVCGAVLDAPVLEAARLDDPDVRYGIARCPGCGAGRTVPWPDVQQLRTMYDGDYEGGAVGKFSDMAERLRRGVASVRARRMLAALPANARVLDIGCGDGKLVSAFCRHGALGVGLEGTRGPGRQAAARVPGRVLLADPAALPFRDGRFDLVVIWHVLEHLERPRLVIAEIARCLAPHGRLVVAVPNVGGIEARIGSDSWTGLDVPRHLHHFTPAALRRLVEGQGFSITGEGHFNAEMSAIFMVDTVLRRIGLARLSPFAHLHAGSGRRWRSGPATAAATALLTALLLPPSLVLCAVAAVLRRGGDVRMTGQRLAERSATSGARRSP